MGSPMGDEELLPDQIDAGHHLGDGVFHLDAGVHFQEEKGVVGGHQEFHGAGAEIVGGPGHAHRGLADAGGQRLVEPGGGHFNELLVTPLDGAVAGAEVHHGAEFIRQDLHLDVLGAGHPLFQVDVVVAEGDHGLGPGLPEPGQEGLVVVHPADAPAAPARDRLDHHGIAVCLREGQGFFFLFGAPGEGGAGGDHRNAGFLGDAAGDDLAAHVADNLGGRPDENDAGLGAGLREFGVFGEEAVPRVDGLGPGFLGGLDDFVDAQVVPARARADADGFVGPHDVEGILVGLLVDRHHFEVQFLGGAHDAHGYFAPVGHQNFFESWTDNHGYASAQARPARKGRLSGGPGKTAGRFIRNS